MKNVYNAYIVDTSCFEFQVRVIYPAQQKGHKQFVVHIMTAAY